MFKRHNTEPKQIILKIFCQLREYIVSAQSKIVKLVGYRIKLANFQRHKYMIMGVRTSDDRIVVGGERPLGLL